MKHINKFKVVKIPNSFSEVTSQLWCQIYNATKDIIEDQVIQTDGLKMNVRA